MHDHVDSPALVLIESANPVARVAAHLELGRRASARDDVHQAALHFREAMDLDPTDERPREALRRLGLPATPEADAPAPRRGFWRWIGGRGRA